MRYMRDRYLQGRRAAMVKMADIDPSLLGWNPWSDPGEVARLQSFQANHAPVPQQQPQLMLGAGSSGGGGGLARYAPGGSYSPPPYTEPPLRRMLGAHQEQGLALRDSSGLGAPRRPMHWYAPEEFVPPQQQPERVINVQAIRDQPPQAPRAQAQAPRAQAPRAAVQQPQAPRAQAPRAQAPLALEQAPKAHAPRAPAAVQQAQAQMAAAAAPRTGSFGRNLAIGGGLLGLGALGYGAYRMANRGDDQG